MAIEAIGYSDRALDMPAVSDIPADCAVVTDVGPRNTYSPDEVQTLKNYLARGGRLLLMYDPEFPVTPELQSLLGDVGLKVGSGMVVDPVNHSGTDENKVAVPYYPPHPITDQVALTVFPGPRPLELVGKIPGIEATTLVSTSQESYVRPNATPRWPRPSRPFRLSRRLPQGTGRRPWLSRCRATGQKGSKRASRSRSALSWSAAPPSPPMHSFLMHRMATSRFRCSAGSRMTIQRPN